MSVILFPTDFSGYSENAFQYILHFADRLRAKIIFQYVIPGNEQATNSKKSNVTSDEVNKNTLQLIHELKFRSAEFAFKNNCSIVTDHIITAGNPADEICKAAEKMKPILIAISTHTYNTKSAMHVGNTTSEVLKKSKHPVLVIPEQAFYKQVNNIALATDLDDKDEALIYKLMITAALFDAKLHVFHVAEKKDRGSSEVIEYLSMVFKYPLQMEKIAFEIIHTKAIERGIDKYVKQKTVDLLCLQRKNTGFNSLFTIKSSERKDFHQKIPTLVYTV